MNIVHLKKGESAKTYAGSIFTAPVTGVYVDYNSHITDMESHVTGWSVFKPDKRMKDFHNRIGRLLEAAASVTTQYATEYTARYIGYDSGIVTIANTGDHSFNRGEREDE